MAKRRAVVGAAYSRELSAIPHTIPRPLPIPPRPHRYECVAVNKGHIALRKGRHSVAGQVYLVTFATSKRAHHFAAWDIGADAARARCRRLPTGRHPGCWHGC